MRFSDIPRDPSTRMLRQFAALWLAFFSGLGLWQGLVRGNWTAGGILIALALSLGPLGLLRPAILRPIFVAWMILAFPIGWTVSHVLLALLYCGLLTPVALVFKITGRDALARKQRRDQLTYWTDKPLVTDVQRYFRQY